MISINEIIKQFILGEEIQKPDIMSYIQAINELLSGMTPKTVREIRNLNVVKQHLKEVSRLSKRANEKIKMLEEQVKMLEEEKINKRKKKK